MVKEMNNKKMRFVADNDPKVIKIVEGCAEWTIKVEVTYAVTWYRRLMLFNK